MIVQPYFSRSFRLSCVTGFSYIRVFMAGAISFGQVHASRVVVSISSAIPCASLAATFAVAGATIARSAAFASSTCATSYRKFLSKVSVRHLLPVSVSNVIGLMMFIAFFVMIT